MLHRKMTFDYILAIEVTVGDRFAPIGRGMRMVEPQLVMSLHQPDYGE